MISLPIRSNAFFGRDRELSLLEDRLRAAERGESSCVLVRSEHGGGKTRLIAELRSKNPDSVIEVLHCDAGDDAQSLAQRVRTARAHRASSVVVEDVDRAGNAVFDALGSLADATILLIVTFSPGIEPNHALEESIARLRMRGAYEITLGPLDDRSMQRIVSAFRVQGARLNRDRVLRVVHLAGGNPGLATEITRTFLATPFQDESNRVPDAALARAKASLDKLAIDERHTILIAALIGARFSVDFLREISGSDLNSIAAALQHATDVALVAETERGSFAFTNPLLHEAVLSQATRTWAAGFHERIATKLEAETDLAALEESARHYEVSGASARAADVSDRVAAAHLDKGAFLHAARNLRRSGRLHGDDRKRAASLVQLAEALNRGGFDDEALRVYEEIVADARVTFSVEEEAAVLMQFMQLLWGKSEMDRAKEIAHRILAMELPNENPIKRTTLTKLAGFAAAAARFPEALHLLQQLEELGATDISTRAHIAQLRGFAISATESFDAALPYLRESITLIESGESVLQHALFCRNFGMLAGTQGYTAIAMEMLERSFRLSEDIGSESFLQATAGSYVDALVRCGRIREAGAILDAIDIRVCEFGGLKDYYIVATMLHVGSLLQDAELIGRALELEDALVESALRSEESQRIASIVSPYAEHHWSTGNPERAQHLLTEAVARVENVHWNHHFPLLVARCGRESDLERARTLLVRDSSTSGRVGGSYVALFDAFAARRKGNGALALRYGKAAAAAFSKLGWPLHEARALEAAGAHAEALAIYERVESLRDAAMVRDAIRPRGGSRVHAVGLTERERAVALLAARGLRNKEIAAQLELGVRTVEFHLQGIYSKLGIKSRWQIPMDIAATP